MKEILRGMFYISLLSLAISGCGRSSDNALIEREASGEGDGTGIDSSGASADASTSGEYEGGRDESYTSPVDAAPSSTETASEGGSGDLADSPSTSGDADGITDYDEVGDASSSEEPVVDPVEPSEPTQVPPGAGLLTAGDWDDNLNFDHFVNFVNGLIYNPFSQVQDFELVRREKEEAESISALDIVFVIDATGSMGDELEYLKKDVNAIVEEVALVYNGISIHTGAVLYRDVGDSYVTRTIDFEANVLDFQDALSSESAGGGGDYPEAMDEGLAAANAMQWRSNATKVIFLLADAPTHDSKHANLHQEIQESRNAGITIYPVAASGVDVTTEMLMRTMAQETTGRYVFLTDDSGIGGSHLEPTIPCYNVRPLSSLLSELMIYELSGVYELPEDDEIIRSVGNPVDGQCVIEDQSYVICHVEE